MLYKGTPKDTEASANPTEGVKIVIKQGEGTSALIAGDVGAADILPISVLATRETTHGCCQGTASSRTSG